MFPKRTDRKRDRTASTAPAAALRFTPTAWAKLLCLRDSGETEVGGFGIAPADDLLCVEDIGLVQQACSPASVAFDDESVADFFDRQVDAGRKPPQFARIWVHTHPGNDPGPSMVDEETFLRVFGRTEWAVMLILARGGSTYARLQFHVGPGGRQLLSVEVDYSKPFSASDYAAWQEEHRLCVHPLPELGKRRGVLLPPFEDPGFPAFGQDEPVWDVWMEEELAGVPPCDQERAFHDDSF
jgi:hypothetical protein